MAIILPVQLQKDPNKSNRQISHKRGHSTKLLRMTKMTELRLWSRIHRINRIKERDWKDLKILFEDLKCSSHVIGLLIDKMHWMVWTISKYCICKMPKMIWKYEKRNLSTRCCNCKTHEHMNEHDYRGHMTIWIFKLLNFDFEINVVCYCN